MASEATDNYEPKHHSVDDNGDIEMALSTVEKDRGVEQEHSSAVPTVVVFSEMPKTDVETEMGVIIETLKTETSADRVTEICCDTGEMPNQEHSIDLEHMDSRFPDWMHADLPVSEIPLRPIKYGTLEYTKHRKKGYLLAKNTKKQVDARELVKIAKLPNSLTRAERVHAIRHHAGRLQLRPKDYDDLLFTTLHQVAWGDGDQMKLLKKPKIPGLNALATGGLTPLHVAAFRGQTKVVEILLSQEEIHLDAKTTSIQVMTRVDMDLPTSETSTNSGSEVYRRKGDANSSTEDGKMELWAGLTALHLAADGDHPEVVKLLLEAARNKGDRFLRHFVNAKDGVLGRTALHFACRNGSDAVVKELLQCKDMDGEMVVDWEAKDSYWGHENGYTPFLLTAAAEGDHYKVMRLFFNKEILPNFRGVDMSVQLEDISMNEHFHKMQDKMDWRLILTFPKLVDSYYTDVYQPQCFSSELLRGEPEEFRTMQSKKFSAMRLAIRGNNAKLLQRCLIGKLLQQKPEIWRSQSYGSARNMNKESLIREFLHYAARIGSQKAVKVLLYTELSTPNPAQASFTPNTKSAARANSMLNGSNAAEVAVRRLFAHAHMKLKKEDEIYNAKLWKETTEVVNIIAAVKGFDSCKRDSQDRTIFYHFCECATVMPPMEKKLKKQRTMMIKNITQKFVANSEDIRNTCTLYENEKLKLQNACNAILVGATLVAGLAYNGLLQPPRPSTPGINYYENLFWTFNSLAFYFTIYTIICCLEVIIPRRRLFIPGFSEYVEDEIENLRVRVTFASFWFTLSTTLAIGAYVTGEFLMAPSKRLVLTSGIFGLMYLIPLIVIFLGHDYARLARDLFDEYHWFNILFHRPFFIASLIQRIRDSLAMFMFPSPECLSGSTEKSSPSREDNEASVDDVKQKGHSSTTTQFSMRQWRKFKRQYLIISNVVITHFVVIGAVFVFWISMFSHPSITL